MNLKFTNKENLMKSNKTVSEKRQKLIDALIDSKIQVGEKISAFIPDTYKGEAVAVVVLSVTDDGLTVKRVDSSIYNKEYSISSDDVDGRDVRHIGENPFDESNDNVRPVAFVLESILFGLNILGDKREDDVLKSFKMNGIPVVDLNWNPYIYKNGVKEYYQRGFCWKLKDKQLLIESIYQGIDCGKILVRLRGWKTLEKMAENGETELAFKDLVDGKQRLNAVKEFMLDQFSDLDGNFYSDLSAHAQWKFTDHQLFSYAELPESSTDASVIRQFLKMNFTGVQQSIEHLDFVKSLRD